MASLTPRQKQWIVAELAVYGTPTDVAVRFTEQFGVAVDKGQVHTYDAGRARNRGRMSDELIKLFDRIRQEWNDEVASVPIANQRWRLSEYQRMIEATDKKAVKSRLRIMEQAAKDEGNAFTNRRDVTSNGQTIKGYGGEVDFDDL